jgi:hypothetical protein
LVVRANHILLITMSEPNCQRVFSIKIQTKYFLFQGAKKLLSFKRNPDQVYVLRSMESARQPGMIKEGYLYRYVASDYTLAGSDPPPTNMKTK